MKAEYDVTAVQVDTIKQRSHQLRMCNCFSKNLKGLLFTFIGSNGSVLIFELKFGPRCRTDRVVDLNVSNVYIYAVKVFILHEDKILLAIFTIIKTDKMLRYVLDPTRVVNATTEVSRY